MTAKEIKEIFEKYINSEPVPQYQFKNALRIICNNIDKKFYGKEYFPLPWPYNLIYECSIFLEDDIETDELERRVIYACKKFLTERENNIINSIFKDCITQRELATKYNLTEERIRQIKYAALRKIRDKWNKNFNDIINGGIEITEETEKSRIKYLRQKDKYDKALQDINIKLNELKKHPELYNDYVENVEDDIINLELSVRTYNCLKRAGINTIGRLFELKREEIKKIRNLGDKSFKEICDKVKEKYGKDI